MGTMPTSYLIISYVINAFFFQLRLPDVQQRCLTKGFTPDQFDACLGEFEDLNVWQINSNRTKITFVQWERLKSPERVGVNMRRVLFLYLIYFLRWPERLDTVCIGEEAVVKCAFTVVLIAIFNVSRSFELFCFIFRYKESFFVSCKYSLKFFCICTCPIL